MFFLKSHKAFTLIEVLVVLLIMVFIFTLSARRIFSSKRKINTTFTELIRLNRRLYTSSQVHRNVYRLAIKFNDQVSDEYWVEKRKTNEKKEEAFVLDNSFFSKPQKIHPLLDISSVEFFPTKKEEQSEKVYIYYYPQGLSQEIAIQILRTDNQGKWTLYLDPVTKEMELLKQEKSLNEIREDL